MVGKGRLTVSRYTYKFYKDLSMFKKLMALALLAACSNMAAADTYNAANQQLTIPSITVGATTYTNIVVTVAGVVSVNTGVAGTADSYTPATNVLTIPSITVAGTTYTNVLVTVGSVVSVGSSITTAVPLPVGYVSQGGLTWMPVSAQVYTYAQATAFCAGTINGQTGWRLPTATELSGLATLSAMNYGIAAGGLYGSGAMNGHGWTLGVTRSSTPTAAGDHFFVGLDSGWVGWVGDTGGGYVTCVR